MKNNNQCFLNITKDCFIENDINILTCNINTSNDIISNLNYKIEYLMIERENLAMGTEDLDEILRQNIQTLINTGGYCRYLEEQLFASVLLNKN